MLLNRKSLVQAGYDLSEQQVLGAEAFLTAVGEVFFREGYDVTLAQVERELGAQNGDVKDSFILLKELGMVRVAPGEIGPGNLSLETIKLVEVSPFWVVN